MLICIRCHDFLPSVRDTAESVLHYTDPKTTKLVFAADRVNNEFISNLVSIYKQDVYVSYRKWRWGAGLFGLLMNSIMHFTSLYNFNHFLTIDYDTLFINSGADKDILDLITSEKIGLLGVKMKSQKWDRIFTSQRRALQPLIGSIPPSFQCPYGLQGGAMVLTNALLRHFYSASIFDKATSIATASSVADDHLLPAIVKLYGFQVVSIGDFAKCSWKLHKNPRGWEKQGIKIIHPVKSTVKGNNRDNFEWELRKYFKKLRK